jgi:C_GCAxxG_C_C family probable redox protein
MNNAHERAIEIAKQGYNCAQSVFLALAENKGIEQNTALKLATGLGGGIARRQKTCGAITGAILAIGLLTEIEESNIVKYKDTVFARANLLFEQFEKEFCTTECIDLVGEVFSDDSAYERFKNERIFETKCFDFIRFAAEAAENLLNLKIEQFDT